MKLNILPRRHLAWQSPYFPWYGKQYDFSKSPLLPFGCKIMAHTPASLQSKLSPNAQLHYYVGSAPFHKAGIMLYNPKTKQTIIRRSFTQIESSDPIIPELPVTISDTSSSDISQSIFPNVPNDLPPEQTRLSKRLKSTVQHTIPYQLRSRSSHPTPTANNVLFSNSSHHLSTNPSSSQLSFHLPSQSHHTQPPSTKFLSVPDTTISAAAHNIPPRHPSTLSYGHSPLFFFLILYILQFSYQIF
jgi:hypothetical protein